LSAPATASEPGLALLRRGEALLEDGNVLAARLFFERAALQGNAMGALRAAKTYDPDFIAAIDAPGLKADVPRAIKWYRQAFNATHDPEVQQRLAALSGQVSPAVTDASPR
jgi:TPR repeat protein